MKFTLKTVSEFAGTRLSMKTPAQIKLMSTADIQFQYRGLCTALADVSWSIMHACKVTDTEENIYSELREVEGNITMLENGIPHPLGAFIMVSWIDKQMSVDPSGSGMYQREQMEQHLLRLQEDPSVTLHDLRKHADETKQRVIAIASRDPQQAHAANVSAQEKYSNLAKAACRRTMRVAETRGNDKMQSAAELIKASFVSYDMAIAKPLIHDFHVKVTQLLSQYLPPEENEAAESRPGAKRKRTESQDAESSDVALLAQEVKNLRSELLASQPQAQNGRKKQSQQYYQ
jgi:hypothetical protein